LEFILILRLHQGKPPIEIIEGVLKIIQERREPSLSRIIIVVKESLLARASSGADRLLSSIVDKNAFYINKRFLTLEGIACAACIFYKVAGVSASINRPSSSIVILY
jgi:hypothetical protein